jgi:hypothetical protein
MPVYNLSELSIFVWTV